MNDEGSHTLDARRGRRILMCRACFTFCREYFGTIIGAFWEPFIDILASLFAVVAWRCSKYVFPLNFNEIGESQGEGGDEGAASCGGCRAQQFKSKTMKIHSVY